MDSKQILTELMNKSNELMELINESNRKLSEAEDYNNSLIDRRDKLEEAMVAIYEEAMLEENPLFMTTTILDIEIVKKYLNNKKKAEKK